MVCPLHTGLVRCLQPVLVSRKDPDSRKNTIQEIESRAKSAGHWPQVSCNLLIVHIFHVQRTHVFKALAVFAFTYCIQKSP